MKIVFFGTPEIAARTLRTLLDQSVEVVAVVTQPDRPRGRKGTPQPPPVKVLAEERGIPLFQPEKASTLPDLEADLFVVVAYGQILNRRILDLPKFGCINVHYSLLPQYRGAAPFQHAILNGETETGVTVQKMVRKLDAGDVIASCKVEISPDVTSGELAEELLPLGSKLLLSVIEEFSEKGEVSSNPQDESKVSFAPTIQPEDGELNFEKSGEELHNLVRAFQPVPGAWCFVLHKGIKKRLKIIQAEPIEKSSTEFISKSLEGKLILGPLLVHTLQLEGKKAMSSQDLLRGVHVEDLKLFTL